MDVTDRIGNAIHTSRQHAAPDWRDCAQCFKDTSAVLAAVEPELREADGLLELLDALYNSSGPDSIEADNFLRDRVQPERVTQRQRKSRKSQRLRDTLSQKREMDPPSLPIRSKKQEDPCDTLRELTGEPWAEEECDRHDKPVSQQTQDYLAYSDAVAGTCGHCGKRGHTRVQCPNKTIGEQ